MKKSLFLLLFTFSLSAVVKAQDPEEYKLLIADAWHLYESEKFRASGEKYAEAFRAMDGQGMVNDRYNAACSWALAGETDSAFVQLYKIARQGNYQNLGHLSSDADLQSLYEDERWEEVRLLVKNNLEIAEASLDKVLVARLDTIYELDQIYRKQIQEVETEFGRESAEMQALWRSMKLQDSINLHAVRQILDEKGWLGPDIIGKRGNSTLFLVIQHADLAVQEQYLPMMKEAVSNGNASASSLALLEDRIALRNGNKQLYGSQIGRDPESGEFYVLPLIDPDHVDQRRASMGLGPLKDYIANWGMTWDAEAYKEKLPQYENR